VVVMVMMIIVMGSKQCVLIIDEIHKELTAITREEGHPPSNIKRVTSIIANDNSNDSQDTRGDRQNEPNETDQFRLIDVRKERMEAQVSDAPQDVSEREEDH